MISKDFLFTRQTIVGDNASIKANNLLHLDGMTEETSHSFLATLFSDVDLVDTIKPYPIFIKTLCSEVENIPSPPASFNFVLFFDAKKIALRQANDTQWDDMFTELRLQGYQLGIRNPSLAILNRVSIDPFIYVEFNLSDNTVTESINLCNHPSLSQKNLWFSHINSQQDFTLVKDKTTAQWFSGDFLSESIPVKGRKIPTYRLILSKLLTILKSQDGSLKQMAECIETDPTLTFRVIKLTKTVTYYRQFNVQNVQRAIEIIGFRDLIKWVSLAMFSSIDGKPDCLFSMAVHRACFCESLAKKLYPRENGAFLTGLFSYLPSFFDESLEQLLKDLPLSPDITDALLNKKGNLGYTLSLVMHYESGRWDNILFDTLAKSGVSKQTLRELYIESLRDAKEIYSK
ncbi:HDOD domain protein [Marinomonas spartinae]|uniref:EAL and HDOD domain-containing protein n=1 Tax=Marinomonas spartinae TaxID=1792290 RepID=UPI00080903B2|nr:HDOD domain-containing protein [Marinomonas spartinae]SBS37922.1 HDOD domain protein [Marinomonas spartinae]